MADHRHKGHEKVQVIGTEHQHRRLHAHRVPIRVSPQIAGRLPGGGDAVAALHAVHPQDLAVAQLLAVVAIGHRAHHGAAGGGVLLGVVLLHVVHPVLSWQDLHTHADVLGGDGPAAARQLPPAAAQEEQHLGHGVQEGEEEHAGEEDGAEGGGLREEQQEEEPANRDPQEVHKDAEGQHQEGVHHPHEEAELAGLDAGGGQHCEEQGGATAAPDQRHAVVREAVVEAGVLLHGRLQQNLEEVSRLALGAGLGRVLRRLVATG
mmetsp:Transcript_34640/g.83101  ORF Transcript_34640/g.83101 Transcript_34640/m.83101 type:complete len:263 (+) Transcript_34640:2003-2791(+)